MYFKVTFWGARLFRRDVNAAFGLTALILGVVLAHAWFLLKVSPWAQGRAGSGIEVKPPAASPVWQLVAVPALPEPRPRGPHGAPAVPPTPPLPVNGPQAAEAKAPLPESQLPTEQAKVETQEYPETQSPAEAAPDPLGAKATPSTPSTADPATPQDLFEADLNHQAPWPTLVPPSQNLNYSVRGQYSGFPVLASAVFLWDNQGENYQAQAEINLMGFKVTQRSQGQLSPQGLAPVRFSEKRRSEIAAHFNAEKKLITYSANTPDAPLRPLQQDQLSVFIQLASWVAGDPAHFIPGTRITVPVSSARGPDFWLFNVDGPEALTTPSNPLLPTLKLHRLLQKETDTAGELWLAPNLHYLPARIKLTDARGNVVDQTLD